MSSNMQSRMSGPHATLGLNFMNRSRVHTDQRDFLWSLNANKGGQLLF